MERKRKTKNKHASYSTSHGRGDGDKAEDGGFNGGDDEKERIDQGTYIGGASHNRLYNQAFLKIDSSKVTVFKDSSKESRRRTMVLLNGYRSL